MLPQGCQFSRLLTREASEGCLKDLHKNTQDKTLKSCKSCDGSGHLYPTRLSPILPGESFTGRKVPGTQATANSFGSQMAAPAMCTLRHLPAGSWECLARICQLHGKALSPVRAQTLPRRKLTEVAPIPAMGCQPWPGCDEGRAGRLPPLLCRHGLTGGAAPHPSRDTLRVSAQEHHCVPPDRPQSVPLGGDLFQRAQLPVWRPKSCWVQPPGWVCQTQRHAKEARHK